MAVDKPDGMMTGRDQLSPTTRAGYVINPQARLERHQGNDVSRAWRGHEIKRGRPLHAMHRHQGHNGARGRRFRAREQCSPTFLQHRASGFRKPLVDAPRPVVFRQAPNISVAMTANGVFPTDAFITKRGRNNQPLPARYCANCAFGNATGFRDLLGHKAKA